MADIDVTTLTGDQLDGTTCVVCRHVFSGHEHPVAVGYIGSARTFLYACPGRRCTGSLSQLVTDNRPKHALTAHAEQWCA